jgi:carbon storage regulator
MLILARRINESIVIADEIRVSVIDIKGDQIKLGIEAPRHVKVYRQEVYDAIQAENREAAKSAASRTATSPLPSLSRASGTAPKADAGARNDAPDASDKHS